MSGHRDPVHLVALGDSQAEGIGDPLDLGAHSHGGFVNRLVDAWRATPGVDFAATNLAVAGATMADLRRHQLPPALAARPDLAIAIAGVNDARHGTPTDEVRRDYAAIVGALLDTGATVVTSRHPDLVDHVTLLPEARRAHLRAALGRVRAAMDEVLEEHADARADGRLLVVDIGDRAVPPDLFSVDQLHLNGRGHATFAQQVADVLAEEGWRRVDVPVPTPGRRETAAHVAWLTRRYGPRLARGAARRLSRRDA